MATNNGTSQITTYAGGVGSAIKVGGFWTAIFSPVPTMGIISLGVGQNDVPLLAVLLLLNFAGLYLGRDIHR